MPRAKYKKRPDGRWETKVWDGTYNDTGRRNRITVYSTKSSADLEGRVYKIKEELKNRTYVRRAEHTVGSYAQTWFKTFKSVREKNTQAMYKNIIDKHFTMVEDLKLDKLMKSDVQLLINGKRQARQCMALGHES